MSKNIFIFFLFLSFISPALRAQVIPVDGASSGGNYLISNYPGNFVNYYDGFSVIFRSNHTSPANPTLTIGGGGSRPIVNTAGNPLTAGDIQFGQVVTVIYDNVNTEFQMITTSGNVGGGGSPWADGGTTIYPTNAGDFVGIGIVPTEKFEVAGTAKIISPNDPLIVRTTTDGFGVRIREADDGNDAIGLYGYSGRGRIFLKNNGVNTVDIDANGNSFFNGGNVGIGINSPLTKLHVADNAQNGIVAQVSNAASFPYHVFYRSRGSIGAESAVVNNDILGGIIFMSHNGTTQGDVAYMRAKATENHGAGRGAELQFYTTTNSSATPDIKMVIANNGNVGIGTGFNMPLQKLTVDGNFGIIETGATPSFHSVFSGGDQTDDIFYTLPPSQAIGVSQLQNDGSGNLSWAPPGGGGITGGGTATQVAFWSGASALSSSANLFWDNINSRLGVGNASPGTSLHLTSTVAEQTIESTSGSTIKFSAASNPATVGTSTNHPLAFTTNNTVRMTIDVVGKTGIGGLASNSNLEVFGNGPYGAGIALKNTGGGNEWALTSQNGGDFYFTKINGTTITPVVISATGNVGIGTTVPGTNALAVYGSTVLFHNPGGPMNASITGTLPGGNTLSVDGPIRAGTVTHSGNAILAIKDGHIQSQQTAGTMTISVGAALGSTGTVALVNATDVAGKISFTPNGAGIGPGVMATISYGKPYAIAPIVIITAANATAGTEIAGAGQAVYLVNTFATGFAIAYKVTPTQTAAQHHYYYHVIETQ